MFHGGWAIGTFATRGIPRLLTDSNNVFDLVMGSGCGKVENMAATESVSSFRVKIGQSEDFVEGSMKEVKLIDTTSVLVVKHNGNITAVSNKCTVSTFVYYVYIEVGQKKLKVMATKN